MMIKEAIAKVVEGNDLTQKEMEGAMEEIMTGNATPAQIGSFITALRIKGETVDEITGAATVMRAKAVKVNLNGDTLLDTRDRRRWNPHIQCLNGNGLCGCRRRCQGRKTWKPGGIQPLRKRGCAEESGRFTGYQPR